MSKFLERVRLAEKMRKPNCKCSVCELPIYRRPNDLKKSDGNAFCTRLCYGRFYHPGKIRVDKICEHCNSKFNAKTTKQRFCSHSCSNSSRKGINYDGLNSKNRALKSKRLKFLLAQDRAPLCEHCSHDNYNILEAHHIIERCNGGTDELSNLLLLCPNCHSTIHLGIGKMEGQADR